MTAAATLPPALDPLRAALGALSDLRARLVQAEASRASAASRAAASRRSAEDALAAGEDASEHLREVVRHGEEAHAAALSAAGLRRAVANAEDGLPPLAEQARAALHGFEADCQKRLDARYRKSAQQLLALLAEDYGLNGARGDMHHLWPLSQVRIPTSLSEVAERGSWRGVSDTGLGDVRPAATDAAVQIAEARRVLADAERVGAERQWREVA